MQNKGNIRLDVRTLCPVTLHRRVLVWFPAPPPPSPSVSLCASECWSLPGCSHESDLTRLFIVPRTEQAETNFSSSAPESHLCSHDVWAGRNPKERPETTPAWACQNWTFKHENNENDCCCGHDKLWTWHPCSAATTQLNQNIRRGWKYDPNCLLLKLKSSNLQKWVKPSDGDVYVSLWGQNTA